MSRAATLNPRKQHPKRPKAFNTPLTGPVLRDRKRDGSEDVHGFRYNPDEILSQVNKARLTEKAQALINQAQFVGLVDRETRPHFLKLATFSEVGYSTIKEILRLQKAALIKKYDQYLRHGKIWSLEADEYKLLYKAKYLEEPKHTPKREEITKNK